jgi:exopolysaccharide biosynthesis polyprenyl glycosylphosphotransferase
MRKTLVLLGDLIALYLSLAVALAVRYQSLPEGIFEAHVAPFTLIFLVWILVFYIAGLYDLPKLRNNIEFVKTLGLALGINATLAILFFYLIPFFGITPKTTLFLFLIVFSLGELWWRRAFNHSTATGVPLERVVIVGQGPLEDELAAFIEAHPQLGFMVQGRYPEPPMRYGESGKTAWIELCGLPLPDRIIISRTVKMDPKAGPALLELLEEGVVIDDAPSLFDALTRKVPVRHIDHAWLIERIGNPEKFYESLKRGFEIFFSLLLAVILSPLLLLIALLVKLNSRGPALYTHLRVGSNGIPFTFYKFRSMRQDAEKNGAQWKADGHRDPRLTLIGRILVYTHLDELPQLWNILKGELSFVGPRPERPEFVTKLTEAIPFYDARHLVKPGITGWAQINYKYGASVEDAEKKLEYDLWYLMHRSLVLDVAIIIRTIKNFFVVS